MSSKAESVQFDIAIFGLILWYKDSILRTNKHQYDYFMKGGF